jgi:hypothetical protein
MANKVQLKAAGDQDFKDNDPFAELTRIMGFDPRVQPTPRPDEDFEIDLEKELMGMFDPGPEAPAGPSDPDYPQESAAASPAAEEFDDAFAASLEEELSDREDFWEPIPDADAAPVALSGAEAYADVAGEGLAEIDMDFGALPSKEAAPRWTGAAATAEEDGDVESGDTQPFAPADRHDDRNVYRPSFSAPGYATRATAGEAAVARHTGAVEAPVFDIRSFKSAAQQYREAAPHREAAAHEPAGAEAPADERPASRAKAVDPFDILAALGTERGLPQRRDPYKTNGVAKVAEPAPTAPVVENPADEIAQEEQATAVGYEDQASAAYLEEHDWRSDAAGPEQAPDTAEAEESASGLNASETTPFLDVRPAPPFEFAERKYAAADIDQMADAMHVYMAPASDETSEIEPTPGFEAAPEIDAAPEFEPTSEYDPSSEIDTTPEIETTEVFEPAVAVADDLDIPVPAFLTEARPAPVYDELDEEFEHAFQTLSQHTEAIRQVAAAEEWVRPAPTTTDIERLFAEELGIGGRETAGEIAAGPVAATEGFAAVDMRGASVEDELVFDDSDFLPDEFAAAAMADSEAIAPNAAAAYAPTPIARNRGKLLAGVVIGVAVLGGIGAFALSQGGSDTSDQPVVLKADAHPVKVKPKNPGGVSVPNQDNKVYERVEDGAKAVAPEQKKLVSAEEQPVDISARAKNAATGLPGVFEDDQIGPAKAAPSVGGNADDDVASGSDTASDDAPGAAPGAGNVTTSQDIADLIKAAPKGEDRLAPTHDAAPKRADDDVLAVTPHKVRTMIVRADGTMVPREDPAPAAVPPSKAPVVAQEPQAKTAAAEPASANVNVMPAPAKPAASTDDAMAAMAKADVKPAEAPKPAEAAAPKQFERADRGQISTPAKVAIAPSRPADQPVDIIGKAPQKVASAEPASAAEPVKEASGTWSMQIASQPTAEAAQTSYQNMARRYANILGGHAANIVKADIAGKGTYYRVRIAAGSKEDAIALCTKYKAAGGSCFVSK